MLAALNDSRFVTALHWRIWLCQVAILLLLTPAFTFWSQAIFALLLLAKLDQIYFNRPVWSLGRSNLLAAMVMAVLLIMSKQLGVIHLMFHFLLLASLLRLLSIRSDDLADYRQLLWVHYFLIASCFIVHQNLAIALCILTLLALQLQIQYFLFAGKISPIRWRKIGIVAIVFVPLFTGLFVFFPRLPPLWQLPGAKAAQTGLADDMSPGSIEQLVASDQLAFRVTFEDKRPKQSELYWRAKIYTEFDGKTWRSERPSRHTTPPIANGNWGYTVIVEPHQQRVLFSLGQTKVLQGPVRLTAHDLVRSMQDVTQRLSYRLTSTDTPLPDQSEKLAYLSLPPGNPQSRELGNELKKLPTTQLIVEALAARFRSNDYKYTLSPGTLSGDEIDQFIFQTKAGFCSHYAGATVFVLRAAGVPARVIGGYLGGNWQDEQNYLQVRQRDAHAWVEYFADGYWYRFDPTAVVAPDRLENGLDGVLADSELSLLQQTWVRNNNFTQFIISKLDDLDFYWSKWVIAFNDQQQNSLLQELKASWQQLSIMQIARILLITLAVGLILMMLRWWMQREKAEKPVQLFRKLQRLVDKAPNESYQQLLSRVAVTYPNCADLCQQLSASYGAWVFGNDEVAGKQSWRLMRQLVKVMNKQQQLTG